MPTATATTTTMLGPKMCELGGSGGMFFPLTEAEQGWSPLWRSILYLAALLYIFLGVSIVADNFMEAIEMITSKKLRVRNNKTGKIITVRRWNDTVANLTLLALGSSAPEILLSVMEISVNSFFAGVLGPSTIVGSAAFNLFMIIAACIYCIPNGESRAIKEYGVFIITGAFSIVAYLWLVMIVQVTSPDIVEPWEGIGTLLFFPVLVVISYLSDIGYFKSKALDDSAPASPSGKYDLARGQSDVALYNHPRLEQALTWPPVLQKRTAIGGGLPAPIYDKSGRVLVSPAGVLSFEQDFIEVIAIDGETQVVNVPVIRCNGTKGTVTCKYRMDNKAGTAIPGRDYTEASGELMFGNGEYQQVIQVEILRKKAYELDDLFQIILEDPTGDVLFNPHDDGGEESCVLSVKIQNGNSKGKYKLSNKAMRMLDGAVNVDRSVLGCVMWKEAIVDAFMDDGVEEGEAASFVGKLLYVISVPWKVIFAVLIPPLEYASGWFCFIMALVFIGGLTMLIMDFANLFGCVTGCADSITAITFVALGTSMPDLFASTVAAVQDEHADAAIVNVTGSNSVNVFLGIGIPWAMASIYWLVSGPNEEWLSRYGPKFLGRCPNGCFIVEGGDLGFSVVVFVVGACVSLATLRLRRVYIGAELGGPAGMKAMSSLLLVMLWLFYIVLSIWKVANPEAAFGQQVYAIVVGIIVVEHMVMIIGGIMKGCGFLKEDPPADAAHLTAAEEGIAPNLPAVALKHPPSGPAGVLPQMYGAGGTPDGLGLEGINLSYDDDDDDGPPQMTMDVAALVCVAAARFKSRAQAARKLRRRAISGDGYGSLTQAHLVRGDTFHSVEDTSLSTGHTRANGQGELHTSPRGFEETSNARSPRVLQNHASQGRSPRHDQAGRGRSPRHEQADGGRSPRFSNEPPAFTLQNVAGHSQPSQAFHDRVSSQGRSPRSTNVAPAYGLHNVAGQTQPSHTFEDTVSAGTAPVLGLQPLSPPLQNVARRNQPNQAVFHGAAGNQSYPDLL